MIQHFDFGMERSRKEWERGVAEEKEEIKWYEELTGTAYIGGPKIKNPFEKPAILRQNR